VDGPTRALVHIATAIGVLVVLVAAWPDDFAGLDTGGGRGWYATWGPVLWWAGALVAWVVTVVVVEVVTRATRRRA
jgi:hypothetical protein